MWVDWFFWLTAGLIGAGGCALFAWAMWWDRGRVGRARCPRCWYDLSGLNLAAGGPWACAECGRGIRAERELYRTRRRYRWGWRGFGLVLVAAWIGIMPAVRSGSVFLWMPTGVLLRVDDLASLRLAGGVRRALAERLFTVRMDDPYLPELVRRNRLVLTRRAWPRGEPVWVGSGWAVLRPTDASLFAAADPAKGTVVKEPGDGPGDQQHGDRSFEVLWKAEGDLVRAAATIDPDVGRIAMVLRRGDLSQQESGEFGFDVRLVDSVDEIIRPLRGEGLDRLVAAELQPRLVSQPVSGVAGILWRWEGANAFPAGCVVGVRVEFRQGNEVVAWTRGWLSRSSNRGIYREGAMVLAGDVGRVVRADPDDATWSVVVRGDGLMALRDRLAESYWAGEVRLPLRAVWPRVP